MKKNIREVERRLISECVRDIPSFARIGRLFAEGADPNAVNGAGECVLAIAVQGYCALYGTRLRSGFFLPMIVAVFLENGFDVRRHGMRVISELQNSVYDKYARRAIAMILRARRAAIVNDVKAAAKAIACVFRPEAPAPRRIRFSVKHDRQAA